MGSTPPQLVPKSRYLAIIRIFGLLLAVIVGGGTCYGQGWTLSGTVIDAAGDGIGGVDVDLIEPLTGAAHSLLGDLTLADGTFSTTILSPITAGIYSLQLQPPPGYFETSVDITLSGDTDTGNHPLASGWVISGVVLDAFDNPAVGIDIDMRPQGSGGGSALTLSGDTSGLDGAFDLTMPAITGVYEISFIPHSGAHLVETTLMNVFIFGNTTIPAVNLASGHFLTGQVFDSNGIPVSGLDINAYDSVTGISVPLTLDDTDLTGNFNVLIPDASFDVIIRQVTPIPGVEYAPVLFPELDIYQNIALGHVTIQDGFHVTGQVVNSLGQPLGGANFDAEDSAGNRLWISNDGTAPDGDFDLLLPSGLISLEVDPPTLGPLLVTQQLEVAVGPGIDIGQVTLPDGISISGRLVDIFGFPVSSVNVELRDLGTQFLYPTAHENGDLDGLFDAVVEPGNYDLLFAPPVASGVGSMTLPGVSAPQSVVLGDIPLAGGHHFSGIVVDSGIPVNAAEIVMTDLSSGIVLPRIGNLCSLVGSFSIQVPTGTYQMEVIPPQTSSAAAWLQTGLVLEEDLDLTIDLANPPLAVSSLECSSQGFDVSLTWTNPHPDYSQVEVFRDGILAATLPGTLTSYQETLVTSGPADYQVIATRLGIPSPASNCSLVTGPLFLRGDVNNDGSHQIVDAILILGYLFGSQALSCHDAADVNDNGSINLGDPVSLLNFLFGSGAQPAPPYPTPGPDPTPDGISCL